MTTEVLLWVLSGIFISIGSGVATFFTMLAKMGKLSERIVAIEVAMEYLGRKSAKILHSPHDPYGIDSLLDTYLDRHYELSYSEWETLKIRCEEIESRPNVTKDERFLAATLAAICMHKMKIPAPVRRKIEQATNKAEDEAGNP